MYTKNIDKISFDLFAHFFYFQKNLNSNYEYCINELRKQAITIHRLEEITDAQTNTIKELQEMVKQQQNAIRFIGGILKNPNLSGSSFNEYFAATTSDNQPVLNSETDRNKINFKSCEEIKTSQSPPPPSGNYWIDPDGRGGDASVEVLCNMTTGTST